MKDHRRTTKGNIRYSVSGLFFLSIVAIVCGCDGWESIALLGKLKLDWFRKFYPYRKGMPSQDTLERFFGKLSKETFGQCFINWAANSFKSIENEVVSIDGKRMRGSYDSATEQGAFHVVSSYATGNRLILGQVLTQQKSNEISAIPQLLDLIDVKDTVVSIDAMGCQKAIVKKIRAKGADYLIAVKENQKELLQNMIQSFQRQIVNDSHTWHDTGHGRIEKQTCELITALDWMETKEQWQDLSTLVRISTERTIKTRGHTQNETRYYICSKTATAKETNRMVRSHWGIENQLHWVLEKINRAQKKRKFSL